MDLRISKVLLPPAGLAFTHLSLLLLQQVASLGPLGFNVTLGSHIFASKSPSTWTTPSGRFALGFYPEGSGFKVGIWLQTWPNRALIWVANRDEPPVSGDAKLVFTNDGRLLLLRDGDGADALGKPIFDLSERASSASLLDTGNFVVFDSGSKAIWQSFDSPTDTIVANQALLTGYELVSGVSDRNHSSGSFRLVHQSDNNLVLYPRESPNDGYNSYWSIPTYRTLGQGRHRLLLAGDGSLSIVNDTGSFLFNLTAAGSTLSLSSDDAELITFRATLDPDGFFRLYSHDFSRNGSSVVVGKWPPTDDPCFVKGICGYNGYCNSLGSGQYTCSCVPGFRFVDGDASSRGCERTAAAAGNGRGCGVSTSLNESIHLLDGVEWMDDFYALLPASNQQDCVDSCLADWSCEAAFYGGGNCRKHAMPLRYGKAVNGPLNKPSYVTLIKVKSSCNSVEVTGTATKAAERHHLVFLFVGGALAAVAAVALGVAVVLHMYKRRRRCSYNYTRSPRSRKGSLGPTEEISPQLFSYDQLRRATDGFKEELGRGSFGAVYKGAIGGNGETRRLVAVKRLEKVIEEGEREFLTEMRSIGRTHHRNLVRLLGVCHEGQTRLLVYEYMSNGSLASFIFKKVDDDRPRLRWNERVRIAVDVARGILYLHQDCEPHIIHCDIKPQNILMDASRTAKICDFGLAKLLGPDQTRTFTAVRGTRGYLAPEWYKNAPISVKADVYSFGMVLLETICCRKNLDVDVPDEEMILSEWVYRCFREGQLSKLLKEEEEDGEEVEKRVLERMVKVALWCIQEEPALRPTMKMVMAMLEGNLETPIPPPPDSRES